LSLLLKLSPLVDELALYDVVNTPGVAADLSHISSSAVSGSPGIYTSYKCEPRLTLLQQKTTGYLPANDGAKAAFKDADIIVIPAGIPRAYTKQPAPIRQIINSFQASPA
jgi:malate dehydrogenase